MEPIPTPPDRAKENDSGAARTKYPWHLIRLGEWQEWLGAWMADGASIEEARKEAKRVIQAAHAHAKRSGLAVQTRTHHDTRYHLDMKFTKREG